jgi:hypothetical protein
MAADKARISYFKPRKYREVVNQQGRVLLEADWNEGQRISTEEVRRHALDFVGPCGTPDDGYKITAPALDFQIGPGTMYVGGIRNTLEQATSYGSQPDWIDTATPQPWTNDLWRPPNTLGGSPSNAVLVLREQEIVAVEDPALREVALGGPDSAARTRILQRVVAIPARTGTCAAAAADFPGFWSGVGRIYEPATAALLPRSRLQVTLVTDPPAASPCSPPSASGYLGADNQLIRIQIVAFNAQNNSGILLWGYNNASTLYRSRALDGTTVELATPPVSSEAQPRAGQVVQLLLPAANLGEGAYAAALTGHFAKLTAPYNPDTRRITLPAAMPAILQLPANAPPLYVRLWEDQANFTLGTAVTLPGTGLQVTITGVNAGTLHLGDHWSIAARPSTPNAVYPERYLTAAQPPDGPRMWACSLAVLTPIAGTAAGPIQVADCRLPFDNLPELTARGPGSGDSCCCVTVRPEQAANLQEIVDKAVAGAQGAQVHVNLEPGVYSLRRPLILDARHLGIVIAGCSGQKPVITARRDPRFAHGLFLVMGGREVVIRGLEFRMIAAPAPDDVQSLLESVQKSQLAFLEWVPREWSIGIRAVQCVSLSVQNCNFNIPQEGSIFGAGILIQGDNGRIEALGCRFNAERASNESACIGVCLAPILMNGDGFLQPSSAESLRVEECQFAFVTTGILLSSRPLYVSVENNLTRSVHSSVLVLWYGEKVVLAKHVFEMMTALSGKDPVLKELLAELKSDRLSLRPLGITLLLSLGDLAGMVSLGKREVIWSLGDMKASDVATVPAAVPGTLRMTMERNQFESHHLLKGGDSSGSDTLIWDLTSNAASVTATGNTISNRSVLPTTAVIMCDEFNVTGNVIGNRSTGGAKAEFALVVYPGDVKPATGASRVLMFTVTGNTISGKTNLADLPRLEWLTKMPKEFAPILTWEFFNSIG